MMSVEMDERFTAALRELLLEQVEAGSSRRSWLRWPQRWSLRIGLLAGLLASGGGIAAATEEVLSSGPPGSQQVTALAGAVASAGNGTQTVQLGAPPSGANAVYYRLSCLTPGTFTFADGSGLTCSQADVSSSLTDPASGTIDLSTGQTSITITAGSGEAWRLTAIYANATTTPWKVNSSGQTYGTPNPNGAPDLIAAVATNGSAGYVYANQLVGPQPSTPAQAATWSHVPRAITVYDSDGKTPIGQFIVGK